MRKLVITSLLSSALFFPIASYGDDSYLKESVGESTYSGEISKQLSSRYSYSIKNTNTELVTCDLSNLDLIFDSMHS